MSKENSLRSKLDWLASRVLKRIWVRATAFSLAAVAVALLAAAVGPYIPFDPNLSLASGSVDNILNILAASMLAVTTFSLSIMVSAYSSATSNATPRSTKLMLADPTAQNTLSTFVGTFLFSIVGIIGLAAGLYQSKGRVILFLATIVVIVIVVVALLRWIEKLGDFGRVSDTIHRVEKAAHDALVSAGKLPRLGALASKAIPSGAISIYPSKCGLLQHIDTDRLNRIGEEGNFEIHLAAQIGHQLHPATPVMRVTEQISEEQIKELRECVSVGREREFEDDPLFGLTVLSEIASRALSPAVNDPGTAIEVCDAGLRLFGAYADAVDDAEKPALNRVYASDLDAEEMLFTFINPIARDGAANVEVLTRLLRTLEALAKWHPNLYAQPARICAKQVVDRATKSMMIEPDLDLVKRAASQLLETA